MSHWRLSDGVLALLALLAALAMWEGVAVNNWAATRGCGGDFPQYYVAGKIVHDGDAARLYDQPYFRHLQESMRDDPLASIYPPTVGLIMAPLAQLSYRTALALFWAIHAACIIATAVIFYRTSPLTRAWRINVLAALAGMTPLWIAVGIAQWAPVLLLAVAGGLTLHRQGKCFTAGLVLSILALKPQLTIGLVLWMLLRRDVRTLAGLAAGFAWQAAIVAFVMGPNVWFDYLHALPAISAVTRRAHYSPLMEASFTGIASNLLWSAGLTSWESWGMKLAYAASVGGAAALLYRIVWATRPLRRMGFQVRPATNQTKTEARHPSPSYDWASNYEYAAGVLFMMIVPPYFILYDQTLIAVPLVLLWATPRWRWATTLWAATIVPVANLALVLGASLGGFVALAAMIGLAKATVRWEKEATAAARWACR